MNYSVYTYSHKGMFSFHLVIPNGDGTNIFEMSGYKYNSDAKAKLAADKLANNIIGN